MRKILRQLVAITLLSLPALATAYASGEPVPVPTNPNFLFWSQAERDYWFKNLEQVAPTREIEPSENPFPLGEDLQDLSGLTYEVEGKTYTLDDFIEQNSVVGLLIVKNENVVFENYTNGNDQDSRWISFSVTKSVSSMLIGAAIQDGFIESVDDPVTDYLPRLKGSAYEQATIKNVLQMASGVEWNEDYFDPQSDVSQAGGLNALDLFNYLKTKGVDAKPGQKFNYNTGETNLVGAIVRAAIGNNQSEYLERKIWKPFGMESNAFWLTDMNYDVETGGCCINATLRDYARLGIFARKGGILPDGTRVLPEGFMADSTAPSRGYDGYGYLWWLWGDDAYAAQGIFGQLIWINPQSNVIIAMHSSWPQAVGRDLSVHRRAAVAAINAHLTQ